MKIMATTINLFRFLACLCIIFGTLLLAKSVSACDTRCADRIPWWCSHGDVHCRENTRHALVCPATCGLCDPCPKNDFTCEFDTCRDWSPMFCMLIKYKGHCRFTGGMCRRSCGVCVPCVLPPDPPTECSEDCEDSKPECSYWAGRGHCLPPSPYAKHVNYLCKLSCEKCLPCPHPNI